jgi:tetratricopeptide (TPR) repeat protein
LLALTAQVPAKEEAKAGKTSTSVKPKETVPGSTEKKAVEAQPTSTATSPLKTVAPGSIEDKLNRTRENLEKKNYDETVRLANEVLTVEPGNLQAQEYRNEGEVKLKEAALIAQTLKEGVSFYESKDYEQCLQKMEEILKLDKGNPDAQKYKNLADKAIYEQKAIEDIKQVIEHQRKAEENKDLLLILSDIGSDALYKSKRVYGMLLINNYEQIRWSSPSSILPKFKDRNHAEVSFSYIATAVYKKTGSKGTVFDGVKVWTMEKQGNEWKIINEEIKEGKK